MCMLCHTGIYYDVRFVNLYFTSLTLYYGILHNLTTGYHVQDIDNIFSLYVLIQV